MSSLSLALARTAFPYPAQTPSWFAGHMARSLRQLPSLLDEVDLVLEARDARLPLTSVNPAFDALLERVWGHDGAGARLDGRGRRREKIVVYTKRDLAEQRYEKPLQMAFGKRGQRVLFADSRVDADVRAVLQHAGKRAREHGDAATELKVLVVGMPNVGKSSLLNALRRVGVRRGKVFHTGSMPGVTRKLTGTVRVLEDPPVYVFDTPGVMVPFLGHGEVGAERGLKLALTAGIKDGLFEPETITDYLLYKLDLRLAAGSYLATDDRARRAHYLTYLPLPADTPTHEPQVLLTALAGRLGALRKGGEPDMDATLAFLLRHFREGRMGRWTLDDVDGAEAEYVARVTGKTEAEAVEETEDERAPAPPAYEVAALGAVGTGGTSISENAASASSAHSPASTALEQRVDATVQRFLAQVAEERADTEAGRNLSKAQIAKGERQAKIEARKAKALAKGYNIDNKGSKGSKGKGRGRR